MFAKFKNFIKNRPFTFFIGSLLLLLGGIAFANYAKGNGDQENIEEEREPKVVTVYKASESPEFSVLAKVQKDGVIQVSAGGAGIVQTIRKTEGQRIRKGEVLVSLSSTYSGSSAQSVQRQIAQRNYQLAEESYQDQLDMIGKRKELAEKADASADEIRNITNQSLGDTRNLLTLNEGMLTEIDNTLAFLESQNEDGSQNELISQTKSAKAQLLSGVTNLRTALRTAEYQAASDQEPAEISDRTRELTLKQLDVEKRALDMQKDVASLNVRLAQIGEESMNPVSPCNGVLTNINVTKYASIAPGTPLATLVCDQVGGKAIASISSSLSYVISKGDTAKAVINGEEVVLTVLYTARESINGYSYTVTFDIPKDALSGLTNGSYITLQVKTENPLSQSLFVPIDALYQTNDETSVHIANENEGTKTAEKRAIQVSRVIGSFAQIESGIDKEDIIILDRGVTSGQKIAFEN